MITPSKNLAPALFLAAIAAVAWSCAAGGSGSDESDDGGGAHGGGGGSASTSGTGATSVAVGTGGSEVITEVFGHGPDDLYRLDPTTNEVALVGAFQGCESVLDIAIDNETGMFGTTSTGLYAIDAATASCTLIANGDYPNSLSFVPAGTLDANVEALVGYVTKDYVRIDVMTGAITVVKANALNGNFVSSGDIVSVIGGGTYLTIKEDPINVDGCNDCIVEVNPSTGEVTKNFGALGFERVFGLAYWGGNAYGFTRDGDLFEVVFDANSVSVTDIPIPSAPLDLAFWGAGSSTSVPTTPIN